MNSKLRKLAIAGFLSLCTAAPALAGSVTQPGETVGLNTGTPLAPGWYAINTVDWGCRNTTPQHTCTGLTIPVVAWSTPWTIFGGRVQLLAAWPAVEVGVQRNPGIDPGTYFNGMYNPAVFGQLAWDPVVLQGWLTSDVYEKNYGGKDVRGWVRVVLPLNVAGAPFGPSAPATMVRGSR